MTPAGTMSAWDNTERKVYLIIRETLLWRWSRCKLVNPSRLLLQALLCGLSFWRRCPRLRVSMLSLLLPAGTPPNRWHVLSGTKQTQEPEHLVEHPRKWNVSEPKWTLACVHSALDSAGKGVLPFQAETLGRALWHLAMLWRHPSAWCQQEGGWAYPGGLQPLNPDRDGQFRTQSLRSCWSQLYQQ